MPTLTRKAALQSNPCRRSDGHARLASAIGLCLLAAALFLLHHALSRYHASEIIRGVKEMPASALWLAALFAFLNYLALFFYEILAFEILQRPMSVRRLVLSSFVANAFGHTIGFSAFTGAALRYRFYSAWRMSAWEVAEVTALTYIPATFGFLLLGGVAFLFWPVSPPASFPFALPSLKWGGLAMLMAIMSYFAFIAVWKKPVRFRTLKLPAPRLSFSLAQVLVGAVKWSAGGLMLYTLIEGWNVVAPERFLTYYCLAQTAAILTHAPGGLGVLDATLLAFLVPAVPPPTVASALLMYRLFYNLLPLVLAIPCYAAFEWRSRGSRLIEPVRSAAVT